MCGRPRIIEGSFCAKCFVSLKQWRALHFFAQRARVIQLRQPASKVTSRDLWRLWHAQRGQCALTRQPLTRENSEVDHTIPRVRGGQTVVTNLRWVLKSVNRAKHDLSDTEFVALCQAVVKTLDIENGSGVDFANGILQRLQMWARQRESLLQSRMCARSGQSHDLSMHEV